MPRLAALADTMPAAVGRGRPLPWRALAALLAAVVLLHLALVGALSPGGPRAGAAVRAPAAVQLVPPRAMTAAASPQVDAAPPAAPRPAATPPAATPPGEPVVAAPPAEAPAATPRPAAMVPAALQPAAAVPAAPRTTAPGAAPPAEPTAPPALAADASPPSPADASPDGRADDDAPSAPPPIFATQLPAGGRWRYQLRVNGQAGSARLDWLPADGRYTLQLDGRSVTGAPLITQASSGTLAGPGLAPEQFTDRRRGRGTQAAHFRSDVGLISFSGPQRTFALWPGAQDRLSWLPQLAGIVSAADAGLREVPLFVADARGHAGLWRFIAQGPATVEAPQGPVATQLWLREPPRPEGLRVEAWLDPAQGHWPVRVRMTALRSGDVLELLLAEPKASP